MSRLILLSLFLVALIAGCKSRKKAAAVTNAATERTKMEQEAALRKQQEEEMKRREMEEKAKRDQEAAAREKANSAPQAKLAQYFSAISNSSDVNSSNTSINEALSLFSSPETPVLIIISEENGQKDYDRPTTIKAYLNYLKDQKKNINSIGSIKTDGSGKITELELRKNN
jgi:hypothetical protein